MAEQAYKKLHQTVLAKSDEKKRRILRAQTAIKTFQVALCNAFDVEGTFEIDLGPLRLRHPERAQGDISLWDEPLVFDFDLKIVFPLDGGISSFYPLSGVLEERGRTVSISFGSIAAGLVVEDGNPNAIRYRQVAEALVGHMVQEL